MVSITGERADQLAELTCDRRAARYSEITGWWRSVDAGEWFGKGYRSPSAWIAGATREPDAACRRILFLGQRLTVMPHVAEQFRLGLISEQAVGLIADAWHEDVVEAFERDELLLLDWAVNRPYAEAKAKIEAWVAKERAALLEQWQAAEFEARSFSVTKLSPKSMGNVSGRLDNEGTAVVRAALSMLSVPAEGDTRSRLQRNADALVTMARFALAHFERPVGTKRRPPKADIVLSYESILTGAGVNLLDGHLITPESARRLACDAGVHRMITHAGSAVVDYGRQTRTVPDRCGACWSTVTEGAGSRVARCRPRCVMPITPFTGATRARPRRATWCCCAGSITT